MAFSAAEKQRLQALLQNQSAQSGVDMPRSVDNKNPGNIMADSLEQAKSFYDDPDIVVGLDSVGLDSGGFIQYADAESGMKALQQQLKIDQQRNLNLKQFLDKYVGLEADPEGTANAYKNVSKTLNVTLDTPISSINTAELQKAMTLSEGGQAAVDYFYNQGQKRGFSDAERERLQGLLPSDDESLGERFVSDIIPTAKEDIGGLLAALSDIPGTAKGLGRLGVGTADVALGGMFGDMYKPTDPEAAETAREFGRQYMQEIEDFEERPARALVNVAAPVGGALGALGKLGRVGALTKAGRAVESLEPVTALMRGTTAVAQAPFKATKKIAETVAKGVSEEGTGGIGTLGGEAFDSALGFTTGTSQEAMQQLRELTAAGQGETIRRFRKAKKTGRLDVLDKYNDDYAKLRTAKNNDYAAGKQQLINEGIWQAPLRDDPLNTLARLRTMVNESLQDAGARVRVRDDGTAFIEHRYEKSAVANKSRRALDTALEDLLNPKFEAAEIGAKVNIEFLDTVKKRIDDEISMLSPDSDVSKQGRRILQEVRGALRNELDLASNYRYSDLMEPYQRKMEILEAADDYFNIRPDKTVVVEGRKAKEGAYGRLAQALNNRPDNLAALKQFEAAAAEAGGSGDLTASLVGTVFNPLFGSGLVVKSEISQLGRGIAAGGAFMQNLALLGIFSPRATASLTQMLIERGMPAKTARSTAGRIIGAVTAIDKKLPGDLRIRDLAKQGMTLGQFYQRLSADLQQAEFLEE
jgi:hypothetical protein